MTTTTKPPKAEVRVALLEKGMEIMVEKGYSNTGIQEILGALSVPKGSFYHYFESKENYGVELIRHYAQKESNCLKEILGNKRQSPLVRLATYCNKVRDSLISQSCRKGCLIGNLSQEMSDQSEVLRQELAGVAMQWRALFAACIAEGQEIGEIKSKRKADDLAELFTCGWNGATMRSKTLKTSEPLDTFTTIIFEDLLKAE